MNNCLVTALKATIDVDLPKIGELWIVFTQALQNINIRLQSISNAKTMAVSIVGGYFDKNSGKTSFTAGMSEGMHTVTCNEGAILKISNKYNLRILDAIPDGVSFSLHELRFNEGLVQLNLKDRGNVNGDLSDFYKSRATINNIALKGTPITGDITKLANVCKGADRDGTTLVVISNGIITNDGKPTIAGTIFTISFANGSFSISQKFDIAW